MNSETRVRRTGFPEIFIILALCMLFLLPQAAAADTSGTAVFSGVVVYKPVARFTANVTTGIPPLPVKFSDLSTGAPTSWIWDFGDGTNSTDQNPVHTYASGIFTVNLTATNPAGNSTIVSENYITALPAAVSPPQPPSPPASGGGGGSTTSQQAGGNIQSPGSGEGSQGQQAPAQGSLILPTIDLAPYSQFVSTGSSGQLSAIIDRTVAAESGATIAVSGKTVEIVRPAFILTITADTITEVNGIIRADSIQSIQLASTPINANVEGIGPVTASFNAGLASLPAGAEITTTIGQPVNPAVTEGYRLAVVNAGDEIAAVAYVMTVQKLNIAATLPATIRMSVPPAWVIAHGGTGSIVIGRIADDQTSTILQTSFSGYDQSGNMEFVAVSPDGLSVFGLIATRGALQARMETPGFMAPILGNPVIATILGAMNHMNDTVGVLVVILLIVGAVVVVTACIIWRKRKIQAGESNRQEKK
jgi:PKD repeat protein